MTLKAHVYWYLHPQSDSPRLTEVQRHYAFRNDKLVSYGIIGDK